MKKSGGSVRNCRAFTMKKKFYAGSRRKGCEGWTGQATGVAVVQDLFSSSGV